MKFAYSSFAIAALAAVAALTPTSPIMAEPAAAEAPHNGSTMFFADRYVTAYYRIDRDGYRTFVTLEPGPKGQGNPVEFVNALNDGEDATVRIAGHGRNAIGVQIKFHRVRDDVRVNVTTRAIQPSS